ncbi:MAG: hypothetical protein BSOLF_0976 [Candidatus Carbobacillus altaicus]|uniref:Ribosome maturation factor RimP n=1 Tax=Candidatus Carbonibacillus altaicus TaxID=2163959 RepID=A0A2R6Y038_9BACL|nr:MAG: hypothetical protein BSOLF_0976 [Candidatus Carbobacillus altaicus]
MLPILERMALELVDVEYVKEGANWFVRVYIDKEGGVGIEECGKVSEQLGRLLDRHDFIPDAYFLEVSSPGAERKLRKDREFAWAVGKEVRIKGRVSEDAPVQVWEGTLLAYDPDIVLKTSEGEVRIPRPGVKEARRKASFRF